ncbi:hypothetical protein TKK_0003873 [Trichogramma kaykai]
MAPLNQEELNFALAIRAIILRQPVHQTQVARILRRINKFLRENAMEHHQPVCHTENWEPEEEEICSICLQKTSTPPPPPGPWFLAQSRL